MGCKRATKAQVMWQDKLVKDEWNTSTCGDCCVGEAPEPWRSAGSEAWHEPIFCPGCPCAVMVANMQALGMFEDGSIPGCCSPTCCTILICPSVMPFVGVIFAPFCA